MKKNKRAIKKGIKYIFITFILLAVSFVFLYNILNILLQISKKTAEEKNMKKQILELKEEEKNLKDSIIKLKDPDYAARYAREKYLYSKDGEKVIKIK